MVLWCGADSNPGVSRYSWFKQTTESSSWVVVNGSAAAELRIPLASRTDSGHYRCIAENADGDGEASRATSLDVQSRPENLTLSVPTILEAGNQTTITCSVHNVYPSESASMQFESDGIEGRSTQQTQENGDGTGTIKEGDSMVLWCGADSNPGVSRYSWFKQTTESSSWVVVNGSAAAELRIPLASRTDCGHYRCIAENADGDGEASRATSLDVQYPPDLVRVSPCDNRSLCWVCEVEANPLANLTWLEDGAAGRRLMSGGDLPHNGTRTSLRIQMAQQKEVLICAAVNSHGQKQEVKTINKKARPENLTLSVPTILEAGNQTTITCSVHNMYPSESASMQFESDGIEGRSTQQTQENGDGTCVKTVTFTFIPQHFHNRKNLSCSVAGTIKEGDSMVLWCGADSNPGVSRYSWFKQTTESSSWVVVNGSAAAELRIPLASRTDSGHYRCIAENADGDGEASRATSLDVQYPPDLVRVSPCDNRSLCWVCEVEANPLANLTWLEDGAAGRRLMSGGDLPHNGTRTSLRIQMAQQKEELICAAVNSHGQKQEVKTINKKGRETRQRDSSAEASPEVIYDVVQNLTEDQTTESSSWVVVNGSAAAELRIPLASRTDCGHYRCIAENADGDGEASRATSLDVQYPPDVVLVRPCDNRSLCWVCEVEANPLANLTWLEDGAAGRRLMSGGDLLHNGTRTSLRIQMAQQKEELICAAVNSHGQKQEVKTINKKGGTALNTVLPAAVGTLAAFITVVALFCIVRRKGRETRQRDSSAEASPEVIYDVVQNLTEDQEPAAKVSDEEEELVYADLDLAPRGKRKWEPVSESVLTEYSDLKTVAQLKAGDTAASQQ
ncbi:UNVERIFIED_CONTAM: hypothetical protein FKN15_066955 [Acipenser sinensis]